MDCKLGAHSWSNVEGMANWRTSRCAALWNPNIWTRDRHLMADQLEFPPTAPPQVIVKVFLLSSSQITWISPQCSTEIVNYFHVRSVAGSIGRISSSYQSDGLFWRWRQWHANLICHASGSVWICRVYCHYRFFRLSDTPRRYWR